MTKETALHPVHAELGAKFTDFGGWDMPLKYGKELEEHRAVREAVGVFDLSHMGEVRVTGPDGVSLETMTFAELPGGRTRVTGVSVVDSFEARDAILTTLLETAKPLRDAMR